MKKLLAALLMCFALSSFGQGINYRPDGGITAGTTIIGGTCPERYIVYSGVSQVITCSANLTFDPTGSLLTLGADAVVSRYAAKQVKITGDGTGATTNAGIIAGYLGASGFGAIWPSTVTPSASNYAIAISSDYTDIRAPGGGSGGGILELVGDQVKLSIYNTAGKGPYISAGATGDNTNRALSISQTWTDGTSSNIGIVGNFDMGATGTATGSLLSLQAGPAGTTEVFNVGYSGIISTTNGYLSGVNGTQVCTTISATYTCTNPLAYVDTTGVSIKSTGLVQWNANTVLSGSFDTRLSRPAAGVVSVDTTTSNDSLGTISASGYRVGTTKPVILGTAPTIASGGCTSPTVTNTNGTAYFTIDVGTSCSGSQPVVFTLPAATTGWNCYARHVTTPASNIPRQTGAVSTTSVTITNYSSTTGLATAWTDGDDVVVSCMGG